MKGYVREFLSLLTFWEGVELVVLGVLAAVFAGVPYWYIEWHNPTMDPHERGMWEGTLVVVFLNWGFDFARWYSARRERRKRREEA